MAENLSFLDSKSSAYVWERYRLKAQADENFAREIMQLFRQVGLLHWHCLLSYVHILTSIITRVMFVFNSCAAWGLSN